MRKTIIAVLLVVAAIAILSLALGAAYVEALLPGGLPLGNALAALGLCAVAGAAAALSTRGTTFRVVSVASLFAAAAWLPVSVALAGNLELNFVGGRGLVWLILSLVVATCAFCTLLWALAASALAVRRPGNGDGGS